MNAFAIHLKKTREELGFTSAKAFFDHLLTVGALNFNYTYFMKIEGGKQIPSASIVSRIAGLLPKERQDGFVLAYCETLFPERPTLFAASAKKQFQTPELPKLPAPKKLEQSRLSKAITLTSLQFYEIAKSKTHYLMYVLFQTARVPLNFEEIQRLFGDAPWEQALSDLVDARVVYQNADGHYRSVVTDLRFPSADTPELKAAYDQMLTWERMVPVQFNFDTEFSKLQIRRCTKQSREIIKRYCQLLFDIVRSSEDSNADLNQEIIYLDLYLAFGELPG